ncbi:MAG: polymerase subunit sigma-70 [Haloplasmataceae bacterium]|jgi:RNA polymerase sporulation-specific sigma factor|nr:polymerase subunit sigma-70 [Haloplasmataceae bacterium]
MIELLLSLIKILPFLGSIKSKTFKDVLSPEEEKDFLIKKEQGDLNARNKLIEHNLRLVAHIVKKYENTLDEKDDLLSIGTLGLIKAIDTFNDEKGTKLATYAAKCIENEILMQLRSNKKKRNEVSLNDPIGFDKEGNKITLIDVLQDENRSIEDHVVFNDSIDKILSLLPELSDREFEIITRRFGLHNRKPETQRQIAKSLGISRSYVSRIEKRTLMKLYRMLQNKSNP